MGKRLKRSTLKRTTINIKIVFIVKRNLLQRYYERYFIQSGKWTVLGEIQH